MSDITKRVLLYTFTALTILCLATFIYFLYFINTDVTLQIGGAILVVLIIAAWLFFERRSTSYAYKEEEERDINRFALIAKDGEREKEWHCAGVSSFLIGKSTPAEDVDIDFSDTQYCELVSNQHALLNYSEGFWYIEDLGSVNGVGIKKKGDEYAMRLKPFVSYKVDEGDVIYISRAKLLVR
ncbi:MAG: FHA domain-containing protein [Clostridiales bacterium]|nr:FHA domain-containing protein [Clostridiales bacterium]